MRRHFTKHITLMGQNIVTFVCRPLYYYMALQQPFSSIYCAHRFPDQTHTAHRWRTRRTRNVRRKIIFRFLLLRAQIVQISHISHFIMLLSSLRLFVCLWSGAAHLFHRFFFFFSPAFHAPIVCLFACLFVLFAGLILLHIFLFIVGGYGFLSDWIECACVTRNYR